MKKYKWLMFLFAVFYLTGCNQSEIELFEEEIAQKEAVIEGNNTEISELKEAYKELGLINEAIKKELDASIIENEGLKMEVETLIDQSEAPTNEVVTIDEVVHPIEQAYLEELDNWTGNTAEGVEINNRYAMIWEEEMNQYYELIYEALNADKKQWVVSAQAQWELYIQENEELLWQANDQLYHGGSIMEIMTSGVYYDRYRDRALYLKEIYDGLVYEY